MLSKLIYIPGLKMPAAVYPTIPQAQEETVGTLNTLAKEGYKALYREGNLKLEVVDLKARVTEAEEKANYTSIENAALKDVAAALYSRVHGAEDMVKMMSSERTLLKQELVDLHTHATATEDKLLIISAQLAASLLELDAQKDASTTLGSSVSTLQAECDLLIESRRLLEKERLEAVLELQVAGHKISALEDALEKTILRENEEISRLQVALEEERKRNSELTEELEATRTTLKATCGELADAKAEVIFVMAQHEQTLSILEETNFELVEVKGGITTLKEELDGTHSALQEITTELAECKADSTAARDELEGAKYILEVTATDLAAAKAETAAVKEELEGELEETLSTLDATIAQLSEAKAETDSIKVELEETRSVLNATTLELADAKAQTAATEGELQDVRRKMQDTTTRLSAEVSDAQIKATAIKEELALTKETASMYHAQLSETRRDHQQLQTECTDLNVSIRGLEMKLSSADDVLAREEHARASITSKYLLLEADHTVQVAAFIAQSAELEKIKKELAGFKREAARENESLKAYLNTIEDKVVEFALENDYLHQQVAQLDSDKIKVESALDAAEHKVVELTSENGSLQNKVAQLESDKDGLKSVVTTKDVELADKNTGLASKDLAVAQLAQDKDALNTKLDTLLAENTRLELTIQDRDDQLASTSKQLERECEAHQETCEDLAAIQGRYASLAAAAKLDKEKVAKLEEKTRRLEKDIVDARSAAANSKAAKVKTLQVADVNAKTKATPRRILQDKENISGAQGDVFLATPLRKTPKSQRPPTSPARDYAMSNGSSFGLGISDNGDTNGLRTPKGSSTLAVSKAVHGENPFSGSPVPIHSFAGVPSSLHSNSAILSNTTSDAVDGMPSRFLRFITRRGAREFSPVDSSPV
ncbi:hypothetical protein K474DRAFT_1664059 [Panus rudis PR-1116 ss-1]|nr:hypothetical protein K474DRAFT_1664059 [Panus rudis PR-1116 ss-1]